MNVEQMIRKLRVSTGDETEPYVISGAQIFSWLSDAYLRIQLESEQWKFFHVRGKLLTTTAGVAEYNLPQVKEVDKDSLYCNRVGETVRFPVFFYLYDAWVHDETINLQMGGNPRYLISLPSGAYRVEPDPIEAWELWGNAWYTPAPFELLSDEPVWDENYHMLVVWEALKVAAMEWPNEKQAVRIQANVEANFIPIKRAFCAKYLERTRGARCHL